MTFRFVLENGILYFENIGSSVAIADRVYKMDKPAESEVKMPHPEKARAASSESSVDRSGKYYPRYQFSPRIREQLPHEPIVLSGAPGKGPTLGSRRSNFAYLISSGAMMAASLATGMLSPAALLMRAAERKYGDSGLGQPRSDQLIWTECSRNPLLCDKSWR